MQGAGTSRRAIMAFSGSSGKQPMSRRQDWAVLPDEGDDDGVGSCAPGVSSGSGSEADDDLQQAIAASLYDPELQAAIDASRQGFSGGGGSSGGGGGSSGGGGAAQVLLSIG